MKKIILDAPWDYIAPQKTISYPAGEHEVTNEIADAAEKAGRIKEGKTNGRGAAEAGSAGAAGEAES